MLEDFRLKVFMAVAETGSFTKASRKLGVSQPAVSQNISSLEKETGAILFQRARGEVSLTSEGLVFKEYASRIQYWYSATSEMFGQKGKLTSGKPVRICADSVAAAYLLPKPLSMITGSNPDIVFDLTQARARKPILEAADSEEVPGTHFGTPEDADVEISASPSPETIDFEGESKLIGVMEAIVIASPANRSVNAAAVSEEDTEATAKPFSTIAGIHISNRFAVWSGYSSLLTPDLEARTALTSDSIEAIKSVVEESASLIGIVPAPCVRQELASGRLLQMPVRLPGFTFDIHFNPLPEFAGRDICQLLKKTLSESLNSLA